MTCSVAMAASSPVFSPSMIRSFSFPTSPEILAVAADSDNPCSGSGSGSLPSSPYRSRFQKESAVSVSVSTYTPMKRKRPARIDIPEIDSVFDKHDEKRGHGRGFDFVEVDSERFSVFCKRGKNRNHMEDRYTAAVDINGDSQSGFFGIFDGHGGAKAADYVAKNIEKNVMGELSRVGGSGRTTIAEAVKMGYLRTDSELLREEVKGGSCSVTAFIRNNELVVSNAGDCRAVLSNGGAAEQLTSDHRPCREDEKRRIECLGGYVDCFRGVWRLQGSLAVSRGMGDAHLKQWVIAEPETRVLKINQESEFLILASDGLWDKVSNQEAVEVARPLCLEEEDSSGGNGKVLSACKVLADLAVSRGSLDDVSVMIIRLRNYFA